MGGNLAFLMDLVDFVDGMELVDNGLVQLS
jgi:hypothetical protein